jgi:hypothetical protein
MGALKSLVIYERLDFFFDIFKNAKKTMDNEDGEKKAHEWINGKLNRQGSEELYILPERFGQLIFDEIKKMMKEEEAKKRMEEEV